MAEQEAVMNDALSPEVRQQQELERGEEKGAVKEAKQGEERQQQQQPKSYSQEEVDRIVGKVRKNTTRDTELRFRRETQQPAAQQQVEQRKEPPKDEPPVRKDDEAWEDFVLRNARYEGRQASREEREEAQAKDRETKAAEQRAQAERTFRQRADELTKEISDFRETLESADDVMISDAMGEALTDSELGPRILYHLVKNPQESARIAGLSKTAAAREIGKLEARFEAELKAKAGDGKDGKDGADGGDGDDDNADAGDGKQSAQQQQNDDQDRNRKGQFKPAPKKAAPDPIEPTGGRSGDTSSVESDKDDDATWLAKANARARKEGRR